MTIRLSLLVAVLGVVVLSASPGAERTPTLGEPVQLDKRCWPLNGCIERNDYARSIEICIDGTRHTKPPKWTSSCGGPGVCGDDIDHIKEPRSGIWFKIGVYGAEINADGTVEDTRCRTSGNLPCGDCS